jgi:hypothetical protein
MYAGGGGGQSTGSPAIAIAEDDDEDAEDDEDESGSSNRAGRVGRPSGSVAVHDRFVLGPVVKPDLPDEWRRVVPKDSASPAYWVNYARNQSAWEKPV